MQIRHVIPALALAAATLVAGFVPGAARAGLGQEARITEPLIGIGMAWEISEVCPDISARKLRGLTALMSLRATARGLGYSEAQIDDWIDDDAEKDRLEAIARRRLAQKGAARGDVAAHCALGRAEISAGSQVGRLLSAR